MASAEYYNVFDRPDHLGPGPDHLGPGPDHLGPGLDHLGPGPDHLGLGMDHLGPGQDHLGSGPDHLGPGLDHLGLGPDHLGPGPNHLGPGLDHLGLGPDHMRPGPDHLRPGLDHLRLGMDHLGPGPDTSKPISVEPQFMFADQNESLAAQLQVSSSEEEEEEEEPGDSEGQQTGDVAGTSPDGPDLETGPDSTISASAQVTFTDENESLAKIQIRKGKKVFFCEVCKKDFNRSHLKRHKMSHSGERPFSCDSCKKRFIRRSHLNRHMQTHTREKPFSCHGSFSARKYVKRKREDSGEEARSRGQKTKGTQSWYNAAERYILSVLDETDLLETGPSTSQPISESLAAQLHLTSSDEEVEKEPEESAFHCDKSKEVKHCCDLCREGHESSLCDHKQTHGLEVSQRPLAGNRPLKIRKRSKVCFCDICKKHVTNINRHKKSHSGERPYTCDICQRSFTVKSDLKRHMQIHTREKPKEKPVEDPLIKE